MSALQRAVAAVKEGRVRQVLFDRIWGKWVKALWPEAHGHPHKPGYATFRSYAEPLYSPWLVDRDFGAIYEQVSRDVGLGTIYKEGRYVLYCLVRQALIREGNLIECGVHLGQSSHLIATLLDHLGARRVLFSIDSYEGFPKPDERDLDIRSGEQFFTAGSHNNVNFDQLKGLLTSHSCTVEIIKGWIPAAFAGLENQRFCFAHVDVDLYKSTHDSLAFIYPRVASGGTILIDDYGFPMCPGARQAVDEFFADKQEVPLPLPTGQAVVIRV
jgi:O-methyltransferase